MNKIIAMVPARHGSKGIPNKNIIQIIGRPLISYALEPLVNCNKIDSVYINSNSSEYLNIGAKWGARKYNRKESLSSDNTTMKEVIYDFIMSEIVKKEKVDALVVLYPTHPIWTSSKIDRIIDDFISMGGERPFIGLMDAKTHPFLCYKRDSKGTIKNIMNVDENKYYRRQQYPDYYQLAGGLFILPISQIPKLNAQLICKDSYGFILSDDEPYIDIDTNNDLSFFKYLLNRRTD